MSLPLRALLIEVSEGDADLLVGLLRRGGYDVDCERVATPKEMQKSLDKKEWDIVFSDYSVAGLDCFEALKILQEKGLDIPFLLVSNPIDEKVMLACFKAGANDFITKGNWPRLIPAVARELNDAQVRKEQKRLEKVKDEFIATISHEMRTPLAIVKGIVTNLRDGIVGPLAPEQKAVADTANENINRLSRIISDMLDLSKLESQQIQLQKGPLHLLALIEEVLQKWEILIQEKGLKIVTDFDLKAPKIFADVDKIRQVLINILDNAFRFAKNKVTIKVFSKPKASLVHVTIQDDGLGIAAQDMNLLFDKFMQINRPLGGAGYKGTGLGLAIAKEIIDLHQGKIWAESSPGRGTQFHFILPTQLLQKVDMKKAKPRILIVEDEKDLVKMIQMGLRSRNYKILVAYDGKEGVKKAIQEHPDLILLDMVLPKMQGEEVCEELKKHAETKKIPIIVLTAKVLKHGRNLTKEMGVRDYIPKPFDMQELIKKIQLNLRRQFFGP